MPRRNRRKNRGRRKKQLIFGPNMDTLSLNLRQGISIIDPLYGQHLGEQEAIASILAPNADTLLSNARGTVGPLGIHPPEEINLGELHDMEREANEMKRRQDE